VSTTPPWVNRRRTRVTAGAALVGCLGSILIARASYVVGTIPGHHLSRADATGPWRWPYEVGVVLVVVSWLVLGRLVLDRTVDGMARRGTAAAAVVFAPLLFSAPLTSQDVWYYLASGNLSVHGLNPYSVGPNAVHGPYSGAVDRVWLSLPSPYGPLWTWTSEVVVRLTHPHLWWGLAGMRVVAVAGIVMIGYAMVRLCRATGARPEVALWLTVGNPFVALMLMGGVHNDAVMLGLLVLGVAVTATARTQGRGLLLGAVLVGLAAAIKVNALVVAPFLPLVWRQYAAPLAARTSGPRDTSPEPLRWPAWLRQGAATTAVGLGTVLLLTLASGLGLGWVSKVGGGVIGVRWLSVPTTIGTWLSHLAPGHVSSDLRARYPLVHRIGLGFLVVSVAAATLTARRRPVLRTLALVMLLLTVSAPAPRLWYLLWPLVFLAADRIPRRLLVGVVAFSGALVLWYPPSVRPPMPPVVLLLLMAPMLAVAALVVHRAAYDGAGPRAGAHAPPGTEATGSQRTERTEPS
jgi:alpha-1,6-mannosyltransferase